MSTLSLAIQGKGALNALKRGVNIARRYGVTLDKMGRALAEFAAVLQRFECHATFPLTAAVLRRNPGVIRKYQAGGIEFAIHGYRHVDYSQLSPAEQAAHLRSAGEIFAQVGVQAMGFRSPYLRWNSATLAALRQQGLAYDSSQGLAWDVLEDAATPAYLHVLGFYGALSASAYPAVPSLEDGLVRIPYSLPDDEALVERLALKAPAQMNAPWLAMLRRTYELGELFTIGLHPERMAACREPLIAVLAVARQCLPAVWIARLDEVAAWWRERTAAAVEVAGDVAGEGAGGLRVTVSGPAGTTVLARAVEVDGPTASWADGYRVVQATTFTVHAAVRPVIGLARTCSPRLADFLRQQGYIVATADEDRSYAYYFDRAEFADEHKRPLLEQIEGGGRPLVRLGRWPAGARSALCVTGDIDSMTLWDYGLRFLGR